MKKVLNVVGARPNFIKIAPLHQAMSQSKEWKPVLVHTGQHYDTQMSRVFFQDLAIPEADKYLNVGSGSHAEQTAKIMVEFEKTIIEIHPDLVVVVGDVNSTLACSLVACKLEIPIAHVEAGLRSFDRTMPEEINRQVTDLLSDFLFVSEPSGIKNLKNEGIPDRKIHFVGNIMIDSLRKNLKITESRSILTDLKIQEKQFVLVTVHRPDNVDNPDHLKIILDILTCFSKAHPVVFPIHPRTRKNIDLFGFSSVLKNDPNIHFIEPLGYLDFLKLLKSALLVFTDSGGIQEETTYLGVPCLTVRPNTERPVTIEMGTNELVPLDPDIVMQKYDMIAAGKWKKGKIPERWDGQTAGRIVEILHQNL